MDECDRWANGAGIGTKIGNHPGEWITQNPIDHSKVTEGSI